MSNNPISFSVRSDRQASDLIVNGDLQVQGNSNIEGSFTQNGVTYHSVTGYGPTQFATAVSTTVLTLNTSPSLTEDTATAVGNATTALILPAGAFVTRVFCNNNGTTVTNGTDFDVGASTSAATAATYFDAVTLASLNAGAVVAGAGSLFSSTALVPLAAANFVTVTVNSSDNLTGDLAVIIEYALL